MKKLTTIIFVFVVLALWAFNVTAETEQLVFKADYTPGHGPYSGMRIKGACDVDPEGDPHKQIGNCQFRLFDPAAPKRKVFRVVDPEGHVEVTGDGQILRIGIGPIIASPAASRGNFKNSIMEIQVYYDGPVTLRNDRGSPVFQHRAATVNLLGFSASTPKASAEPPDCILFDILGCCVHDD